MKTADGKKRFELHFDGNMVTIITDRTKFGSLDALLKTIFHEYARKPDRLDDLMTYLNTVYEMARNKGRTEEVEPIHDFDFWKGLMERRETGA